MMKTMESADAFPKTINGYLLELFNPPMDQLVNINHFIEDVDFMRDIPILPKEIMLEN